MNATSPLLMTPGPVPVPPEVLEVLGQPIEHHRTPEFLKCLERVLKGLPKIFATAQPAYMHASTGSGGMESLLVNCLSPGDHVACVVSGKFGERWADMAEVFGAKVSRLSVPWGESVDVIGFEAWLNSLEGVRLVLSQVSETSTGAMHPVREMAQAVKRYNEELGGDSLFLVDAITALGALPLKMDAWEIDGVVGGSQKAFMLPTGLSFVAFSARAWKRIETAKCPRFYFDIREEKKANARGETLFSTPVPLVRALDIVLTHIERQGGIGHIHRRIAALSKCTHEYLKSVDIKTLPKTPSPALTAIVAPAGVEGAHWRNELETKYGVILMGGQDQLKGKILRIGHMGFISDDDHLRALKAIADSANDLRALAKIQTVPANTIATAIDRAREILAEAK